MSLRNFDYRWIVIEREADGRYGTTYNARGANPEAAVLWTLRSTPSTAEKFLVVPNDEALNLTLTPTPVWIAEKA